MNNFGEWGVFVFLLWTCVCHRKSITQGAEWHWQGEVPTSLMIYLKSHLILSWCPAITAWETACWYHQPFLFSWCLYQLRVQIFPSQNSNYQRWLLHAHPMKCDFRGAYIALWSSLPLDSCREDSSYINRPVIAACTWRTTGNAAGNMTRCTFRRRVVNISSARWSSFSGPKSDVKKHEKKDEWRCDDDGIIYVPYRISAAVDRRKLSESGAKATILALDRESQLFIPLEIDTRAFPGLC